MNMKISSRKMALAGLFIALEVLLSGTSIPVGPSRVMPLQHTLNAVCGILLGPWYAALAGLFTAVGCHWVLEQFLPFPAAYLAAW